MGRYIFLLYRYISINSIISKNLIFVNIFLIKYTFTLSFTYDIILLNKERLLWKCLLMVSY